MSPPGPLSHHQAHLVTRNTSSPELGELVILWCYFVSICLPAFFQLSRPAPMLFPLLSLLCSPLAGFLLSVCLTPTNLIQSGFLSFVLQRMFGRLVSISGMFAVRDIDAHPGYVMSLCRVGVFPRVFCNEFRGIAQKKNTGCAINYSQRSRPEWRVNGPPVRRVVEPSSGIVLPVRPCSS